MIFRTAKRTPVPVGTAKFHLNRCNESPVRGEKPDFFWPVSKNNTASLPLRGILPVITHQFTDKYNNIRSYLAWNVGTTIHALIAAVRKSDVDVI